MSCRFISKLNQDCRGVATIELALYAPLLALLTIGTIDMSNAFGRKLACEQAVQRAIEKVMQTTGVLDVSSTIINEVAAQANIPEEEKADKITVTYRLECDDEDPQTSTDATVFDTYTCDVGTVSEARYIEVQVNEVYQPLFPMHFSGYSEEDTGYKVTATAGMRTQ
jgi:Flp pilus assembly protein TadG